MQRQKVKMFNDLKYCKSVYYTVYMASFFDEKKTPWMSLIFFANSCMFWLTHGNKKACKYMIYRPLVLFDYSISGEGGIRTLGTVSRTSV